jgi:DNA repair protein RecO (recombination protein O)
MGLFCCEALTLRTYPYSESNLIVVFLSPELGQIRSVAYSAKSGRNNRFGSSLEPLTHSDVSFSRKDGQELAVVKDISIIRSFPAYELEWAVKLHFLYFTELLQEFSNEASSAERMFRLALGVLEVLKSVPILLLSRYFELWLLQLEGVLPPLSLRLPSRLAEKAIEMMKKTPEKICEVDFSVQEVKRLGRLSAELIESHLEKRLKTPRMLKELL